MINEVIGSKGKCNAELHKLIFYDVGKHILHIEAFVLMASCSCAVGSDCVELCCIRGFADAAAEGATSDSMAGRGGSV